MKIRQLTSSDWQQYKLLIESQVSYFGITNKTFIGQYITNVSSMKGIYNSYFLYDNDMYKIYGYFNDDLLVCCISAEYNNDLPFWILRRLVIHEHFKATDNSILYCSELYSYVIEQSEKNGYYQHYYLIPSKYARAHSKIWNNVSARKDYIARSIEIVKPETKPKFNFFWNSLYGRIYYPIETTIRLSIKND